MSRPVNYLAWFLLVLLSFIWGSSFILIKKALIGLNSLQMASLRIFLAWVFFLPFTVQSLRKVEFKKRYKHFIFAGITGNFLPAFFFALAQSRINSTVSGMLNSVTPFFTLLAGYLFFQISANWYKWIGVIIGLGGSLLLILFRGEGFQLEVNFFALFVIMATICYGISANILKAFFQDLKPIHTSSLSLLTVGPLAMLVFFMTGGHEAALGSPEGLKSLGYTAVLSLVGTTVALVLFNRLIQMTTAVFAASVTYLIPVFALFWGVFDGEEIGVLQIGGMIIILVGVFLTRK